MFSELRVNNGRVLASVLLLLLLLEENMLKFHIAVVEDKSLSHELLQETSIDRLKLEVLLEAIHELADILLIIHPILFVLLHLILGFT